MAAMSPPIGPGPVRLRRAVRSVIGGSGRRRPSRRRAATERPAVTQARPSSSARRASRPTVSRNTCSDSSTTTKTPSAAGTSRCARARRGPARCAGSSCGGIAVAAASRRASSPPSPRAASAHTVPSRHLDVDAAERALRRAGQHLAGGGVEVALVAGALHLAGLGLVVDDAAEVGALLAEGPQLAAGQVHEDRRVGAGGVVEQVGRALGHLGRAATIGRGSPSLIDRSDDHRAMPTLPAANPPEASTR